MPHTSSLYVLAALALELKAGREIQLLPAGQFRATDGRPAGLGAWKIDATIARQVIAASARANRLVIDYEHQSLRAEENGQAAPAAGWFKSLEWREGQGLYAVDVEWTARAKQMIEGGEYRYLSPVFSYDPKTGEVLRVLMAAVTNVPAVDGMDELTLRAAARFDLNPNQENRMSPLLKSLLAALSLTEATSEADAIAAVTALKVKADKVGTLEGEIVALKAATPDPAKFVPVATMQQLQTDLTALKTSLSQRDLDEVVTKALTDGKLLPAQEKWARELGAKDMAALKSYIETAQALPALRGTQSGGRGPGTVPAGGDLVAVCKAEFESNAALREEFIDLATYTAWRKAEAAGTVKILGRRAA